MADTPQKLKFSFKNLLKLFRAIPPYQPVPGGGFCKDCTRWRRIGSEIFVSLGECEFYGDKWDNSPTCQYALKKKYIMIRR